MEVGERGRLLYLSLHCHHQNDSCIKMGSDESQFNVSLIVRDKVTRQCPETKIFEEKGEPKRIRTEVPLLALPLGQTDSLVHQAVIQAWQDVDTGRAGSYRLSAQVVFLRTRGICGHS